MQIVITHGLSLLLGAAVCLLAMGFFYLLGVSVAGRLNLTSREGAAQYACVAGAAIFVAATWHGLQWMFPLPAIVAALCVASLVLWLVLRKRNGLARSDQVKFSDCLHFAVEFLIFYAVAYCLVPEMMFGGAELPYRLITGNLDLFHYVNAANYFLYLGLDNLGSGYYFGEAYWVTPGAYHFLSLFAVILHGNTLAASMPFIHGAVALIGVAIACLLREVFRATRAVSISVGLMIISGVFFQYVYGNGFLAQYASSVILMFGTLQLAMWVNSGAATGSGKLILVLLPYCFLTFYIYPAIAVIFVVTSTSIACCAKALGAFATQSGKLRLGRFMVWWGSILVSVFLLIGLFDPSHFYEIVTGYMQKLGSAHVGWPLDMPPFYTFLGIPGSMQVSADWLKFWLLIGLVVIGLSLYFYVIKPSDHTPLARRVLVIWGAAAWLLYFAYFAKVGPSYQQWKMAAYLPLLFSFVFYASIAQILITVLGSKNLGSFANGRLGEALCCILALAALAANAFDRSRQGDEDQRKDVGYEALRDVSRLGGFDDLYVHMRSWGNTMLVAYFIDNLHLHFLSDSYYPTEQYDPRKIDSRHPLLWEGGECSSVGALSIGNIGCLMRAPPKMEFDRAYGFGIDEVPVASVQGAAKQASWGVSIESPHARIVVYAAEDTVRQGPSAYLNLQVRPGPKEGLVRLRLGGKVSATVVVTEDRWLSVPYDSVDWVGSQPAELLLDADVISTQHSAQSGPPASLGLIAVSRSRVPRGEVIELGPDSSSVEPMQAESPQDKGN